MIIIGIGIGIAAFLFGRVWEQSRWVKLQKDNRIKEVDGCLYKVIKIDGVGSTYPNEGEF